ncbi:MAG: PIN domain-containing protein [Deltaproteobacteria bacterium]|nr:PIN domain-containing protein [Nannocystaceae bacterium]
MAFVVVYDACVLFPAPLRDLLIRVARTGVVRAHWSERILEECFRAVLRERTDLSRENLARTRVLMNHALPDANVSGHEQLIESLELPDLDDRHVLAAALKIGAQAIVTFNLGDFPASVLEPFGIEAKHPDDFILEALDIAPGAMAAAVGEQASTLRNPPKTVAELLDTLQSQGLPLSVARLRGAFGPTT